MATVEIGTRTIYPKELLLRQAATTERHIERTRWFRHLPISFDMPYGIEALHPLQQEFVHNFSSAAREQGHTVLDTPTSETELMFGFHNVPFGAEPLDKRVEEIEPLVMAASKRYGFNALQRRFITVVPIEENVAQMPKRQMERTMRMLMERLGSFSVLAINPKYGFSALGTLEGGLGIEYANEQSAIKKMRDRVINYACAVDSGSYAGIKGAISEEDWASTNMPRYIADNFRAYAKRGYIPPPFEYSSVASMERTKLIHRLLGHSRQSESAAAAEDPTAEIPLEYQMEEITGAIIATVTGKTGADKTNMDPKKHFVTVSIRPKEGYVPNHKDPWALNSFKRYALLREGYEGNVPSVEFDEMTAAIKNSPVIRVRRHPKGHGYQRHPEGKLRMHLIRGFKHCHDGVDKIVSKEMWGHDTSDLIEYVPANLAEFPYQVGCGKDIMFACSTDAAARSVGAQNPDSRISVVLFDAINHGTNVLLLAKSIPGTDIIPDDPFEVYNYFVNRYPEDKLDHSREVIQFSDELAQI